MADWKHTSIIVRQRDFIYTIISSNSTAFYANNFRILDEKVLIHKPFEPFRFLGITNSYFVDTLTSHLRKQECLNKNYTESLSALVGEFVVNYIHLRGIPECQIEVFVMPPQQQLRFHFDAVDIEESIGISSLALLATLIGEQGLVYIPMGKNSLFEARLLAVEITRKLAIINTLTTLTKDKNFLEIEIHNLKKQFDSIVSLKPYFSIEKRDVVLFNEKLFLHSSPTTVSHRLLLRIGPLHQIQ
jgi:hypothetical protein